MPGNQLNKPTPPRSRKRTLLRMESVSFFFTKMFLYDKVSSFFIGNNNKIYCLFQQVSDEPQSSAAEPQAQPQAQPKRPRQDSPENVSFLSPLCPISILNLIWKFYISPLTEFQYRSGCGRTRKYRSRKSGCTTAKKLCKFYILNQ